jgi:dUTP pyrophosphatase
MLNVFRTCPEAILPSYATRSSACFDIHACLVPGKIVKRRGLTNQEHELTIKHDRTIEVRPGDRVLVPTGLVFDIPPKHSLRLHPRSGLAYKQGVCLSNCEGVIDEDYIEPVFVCILNTSKVPFIINHGDRICQAELVQDSRSEIFLTLGRPSSKGNRSGGFGSTGV